MMNDGPREKKELEWDDAIPDDENDEEPYEKTYRDGSAQHECWDAEEVMPDREE